LDGSDHRRRTHLRPEAKRKEVEALVDHLFKDPLKPQWPMGAGSASAVTSARTEGHAG
jgi:hypothetical protein